jgi:hypothetical protein
MWARKFIEGERMVIKKRRKRREGEEKKDIQHTPREFANPISTQETP